MSVEDLIEVNPAAPRGLRTSKFIEDVDAFMADKQPEPVLGLQKELLEKFKLMERNHERERQTFRGKLPDLQQAIEAVEALTKLNEKEDDKLEYTVSYKLADTIYAQATILRTKTVQLWLGAETLMEYPLEEAKDLLQRNLVKAETKLNEIDKALEYCRTQIVVAEVNMARFINYGVRRRQQQQQQQQDPVQQQHLP